MKKTLLTALALTFLVPVLASHAVAQAVHTESLDRIIAVVDEDVVLQSELQDRIDAVSKQYAGNPQQLPPRDVLERQLLDRLILQKLQVARADQTGVKVSDAEVDHTLTEMAQQNRLDISQMRGAIEQQGLNYDQFRANVRDQLVVQRLRQRVAQSRVQISDAEIDSLIKNGKLNQGELHLGYIMINVPDGATPAQIDESHAKAEQAKKQIDEGMDFAAAAIRYSNAENALQGGDLGWRGRNEIPPALVEIAEKLNDGDTSAPVRGPNGFYLIKLIGKRDQGAHMVTEYKARHILIKTSELTSSDQAERQVAALRQKIVDGEDFAKVAKDSSQDETTAKLGGEMGWFTGTAYGSRVAEALQTMKPGDISAPFQTELGWHVLQLEDSRNTDKSGEMAREEARNILFQRKAEDEYESFLRQLRSEAYVEIRLPAAGSAAAGAP